MSMVAFIVGRDKAKRTFQVHKEVIAAHSPKLKAAFEGNSIEGRIQTMRLEDVEAETFGLLVQYIYQKCIGGPLGPDERHSLPPMVKLLQLSTRLGLAQLERAVAAILANGGKTYFSEFGQFAKIRAAAKHP
jgi:hypothetical protein